jgi:hypothetical protein
MDKEPLSLPMPLRGISLTVAALRKAQGKPDPNDFPIGSPEFVAAELDFLNDVLNFRAGDPNPLQI